MHRRNCWFDCSVHEKGHSFRSGDTVEYLEGFASARKRSYATSLTLVVATRATNETVQRQLSEYRKLLASP